MAGPIQSAIGGALTAVSAAAIGGKKLSEDEKQAYLKASAEAKAAAESERAVVREAKETAIEADLIRMGADPDVARSFMDARRLDLDTKKFGMIRQKGKFVGSYASLAEKLSKNALADSLTSKVLNKQGFAQRVLDIAANRKGRVEALVEASGGKK